MNKDNTKELTIEVSTLKMLFELGIDTNERFIEFHQNINTERSYFYTEYIYKKFHPNIKNNLWLKLHKPNNKDQEIFIDYLTQNGYGSILYFYFPERKDLREEIKPIYDDIKEHNLTIQNILDKINRIEKLGIGHLQFTKNKTFKGEYKCINKKEVDWTYIEWTFTDGEKEWNTPTEEKEYSFNINKAQYLLTVTCNCYSYFKPSIRLSINTLGFDINSLPTKEDFENPTIDKKYQEIKKTYNLEKSTNIIIEQLKKIKEIIINKNLNNKSYDHLIILFSILNNIEGFEKDRDSLLELIISQYEEELNMSKEEINNVIKRIK